MEKRSKSFTFLKPYKKKKTQNVVRKKTQG